MQGNDRQRQKDKIELRRFNLSQDLRKDIRYTFVPAGGLASLLERLEYQQPAVAWQMGQMAGYW